MICPLGGLAMIVSFQSPAVPFGTWAARGLRGLVRVPPARVEGEKLLGGVGTGSTLCPGRQVSEVTRTVDAVAHLRRGESEVRRHLRGRPPVPAPVERDVPGGELSDVGVGDALGSRRRSGGPFKGSRLSRRHWCDR